jgi:hypothetical protein
MSEISKVKEKFGSIDIEDLKAKECHQKFSLSIVDSIHARFQDSMESIKNRGHNFLASSQGEMSLCLFDSILGGQKKTWDKSMWKGKDYEEAITFAEVSVLHRSERISSSIKRKINVLSL